MIQSACERIKELENELREKDIAYQGMRAQRDEYMHEFHVMKRERDIFRSSIEDALRWIECDTRPTTWGMVDNIPSSQSLDYLEKILKEYLK